MLVRAAGKIKLHQRLQAQYGVTLLGQEAEQLLGIGGDGLVTDHVAEVVDAQHFLGGGIEPGGHVVLEFLGHPDDAGHAALSGGKLVAGDEVAAMAHEARSLYAAAGHRGQLAEGHAGGGHALVLTVDDDKAVGEGLDAADALEAAAGGHGVLHDGVQAHVLQSAVGVLVHSLIHVLVTAHVLVDAAVLGNDLAGKGL